MRRKEEGKSRGCRKRKKRKEGVDNLSDGWAEEWQME